MENMTTTEIIFATDENNLPIYNCINNMNMKEDYLLSLCILFSLLYYIIWIWFKLFNQILNSPFPKN